MGALHYPTRERPTQPPRPGAVAYSGVSFSIFINLRNFFVLGITDEIGDE